MGTNGEAYDYVIIGAGSAGCVLANRLSEDGASVLLLEAGEPDEQTEIQVPAAFSELFESEVDWNYYTEPQDGLDGRELYWPRGKTLGGCSSINAMIYIRGHPSDYDTWADLGNEGWGYEDVLPMFERSEHFEPGPAPEHGSDGPLNVTGPRSPRPLAETFLDAAVETGLSRNDDFNDGDQEGVGYYHLTQKDGKRHSAADAFLKPVLDRPNLTAETGAQVTEVSIEDDRATGVVYEQDGDRSEVEADEEVVLTAGAVNSPQLLMLSGVGPAAHLQEHDIEVQADLPGVGRNLQDHLFAFVVYQSTDTDTLDDADSLWNLVKYLLLKKGPLTSNVAETGGFVRTDPDLDAPDLQFHFAPSYFMRHGLDNPDSGHGFSIGSTQLRPESRGEITLRSADPFDDPVIDPNYLDADADLDVLVEGVKQAREIVGASAFDDVRGEEVWPGEDVQTDAEIEAHVRETAHTVYHPVGTCKMGDDEMAVVDDDLRVHGIDGLRVADASVMPTISSGNTNAPTYMIAEMAAARIMDDENTVAESVAADD
ncbi:GMC family oxidoreductase [Halorientalis salina]|uniref:GMC family oxidoreductase n=1 Tax=Halorientalis salina TaxID=2932266 RepID=UPI0010AB7A66|nr:choline dehydrogenase [Halorientalis salina]